MAGTEKYFDYRLWGGLVEYGRYGVDMFFLISGFIIAAVSLEGRQLSPTISLRDFFARRFIRIIPLMWVAIIAFAVLQMAGRGVWMMSGYLHSLLLLPWGEMVPTHIWTLRQELVYYLLFAATMLTGRRWRFGIALWVIGVPVYRLIMGDPLSPVPTFGELIFSPVNFEFAAGLLLAIVWLRHTNDLTIRLPIDPLLVLALLSGLAFWWIAPQTGIDRGLGMALLLIPVVFLAIHVQCPAGPIRRFGDLVGNASYSIYLFHLPIASAVIGIWVKLAHGTPIWLVVLGCALASIIGGVVLHLTVERRLIAALRRRFGPRANGEAVPIMVGPSDPAASPGNTSPAIDRP